MFEIWMKIIDKELLHIVLLDSSCKFDMLVVEFRHKCQRCVEIVSEEVMPAAFEGGNQFQHNILQNILVTDSNPHVVQIAMTIYTTIM